MPHLGLLEVKNSPFLPYFVHKAKKTMRIFEKKGKKYQIFLSMN